MDEKPFGRFVRHRRRELDLTQDELARRVGCAAITIRKIEAEDARPSVQIAERLAMSLSIPPEERGDFIQRARSICPDSTEYPALPPVSREIGLDDLTGRAIRGYALGEIIGHGGMGAVYRAIQPLVEREVAIKIILPRFANHPEFIRRFEAEAQLIARLEHPHVVPLYDYWREPSVAFLVMRLLRGGNLLKLLQNRYLPAETVVRMVDQIGTALSAAHRMGIIHRDLKPANILLDEDQNAYLADFGIASSLDTIGNASDTLKYWAPENVQTLTANPQSDIYCLGILLYEMLTGQLPFTGPTPSDYIQQHTYAPMPALSAHRTGLPAALDRVIERATAKEPENRYPDVLALLVEFKQATAGLVRTPPLPLEPTNMPLREIANPYKGLRPFLEADAKDFFGRETLVQQLLGRLAEGGDLFRFLAVIGPSGSGKSSVVKAGLLPALRRGGLVGSENWFYVDFSPGSNPFEKLSEALLRVAVTPYGNLLNQLKSGTRGLVHVVDQILPSDPGVELVMVIDQFEELFTLVTDNQERDQFLNSLVSAILEEHSRLRIIITLRADFIDRPLRYVDFGELLQRRAELVLPLTPDEMELAIQGPANRVGLNFEPGLLLDILSDLGNQPGNLPLLQYALTELFERRESLWINHTAYTDIGGVKGALVRRANEVYGELSEDQQKIARQLFLRLVTIGDEVEDTRRRVMFAELENLEQLESSGDRKMIGDVLDAFQKARLLTFDRDPETRQPTVEVAHEALLSEWSLLRQWLEESRQYLRLQRQLSGAANEWQSANRNEGFLLAGARLAQYEDWEQQTDIALTHLEQDYLQASFAQREKELAAQLEQQKREAKLRQRIQRVILTLASVFLIAAVISGGLAYWANVQRQEALRQASIGLASQALQELDGSFPERSALLALEALKNYPYTWQAEQALGQIVSDFRLRNIVTGHTDTVTSAKWSPDNSKFATTSADGTLRIWDTRDFTPLMLIHAHLAGNEGFPLGISQLDWSGDGIRIATAGLDKTAKVWDATTGEEIISFSGHTDEVLCIAWSPNGVGVASAGKDGTVKIWNAQTADEIISITTNTGYVRTIAWSPDGNAIASAGDDGTARLWDTNTGEELKTLSGHTGQVWSVAWSPDGDQVATASEDGTIRVWDSVSGIEIFDIRLSYPVWSVAWSPDGSQLGTTNASGRARIWDASSGKEKFSLPGKTLEFFSIVWSGDGKMLATTAGAGFSARIWNAEPNTISLPGEPDDMISWVQWSPDGKKIAATNYPDSVLIWDFGTRELLLRIPIHSEGDIQDVYWSPDSSKIVTTSWDNLAKVWDATTGNLLLTFTGHLGEPISKFNGITALYGGGWSPDGTRIITQGGDGRFRVWDATTGEEYYSVQTTRDLASGTTWSPDGTRISTFASPGAFQMWDAATGEALIGGFIHNTGNLSLGDSVEFSTPGGWSPDGKWLLTTSWFGNGATIWDADTGEKELTFTEHTGGIGTASWSPNGARIASGDTNGNILIWDAKNGAVLLDFSVPIENFLFQVDWSPDGNYLAGANFMNTLDIYPVWQTTEDLITYAKDCCVVRELTPEERQQFGLP